MIPEKQILALLDSAGYARQNLTLKSRSGGDIHRSFSLVDRETHQATFFVKVNRSDHSGVLAGEYFSLQQFEQLLPGAYPKPIEFISSAEICVLLMSNHALAPMPAEAAASLGALLAKQHQIIHSEFGWQQNNHIGLNLQHNDWSRDWQTFYWHQRLLPQLNQAVKNGLPKQAQVQISSIGENLDMYFADHAPQPRLLHGDLWAGNAGFDSNLQRTLLYDPAPYFGDRETDLAMTELFGGFPRSFYEAYNAVLPLQANSERRKPLYHLYHALNHFNLFGTSYLTLVRDQLEILDDF